MRDKIASLSHHDCAKYGSLATHGALAAPAVTQGYGTHCCRWRRRNDQRSGQWHWQARTFNFGILPVGTMNRLRKRGWEFPKTISRKAWQVIEDGRVRAWSIFRRANQEYFVQLAGVGLDAEVVRQTTSGFQESARPDELPSDAGSGGGAPATERFCIEPVDGATREGSFVLGRKRTILWRSLCRFSRTPDWTTALLDVLVFQNQSHWDLIRYFQAIAFGNHPALPDVEYFQSRGLRLTSLRARARGN